jgi:hypothetical protein
MRRLTLFAAVGVLLCGAMEAAEPAPQISLTVYNSNIALVQDVRRLEVPAGRTRLEFKDVSAGIRPETVTLSGKGLSIVEQNFDYDLLTPAKMLEKAVGKQIKIVRVLPGSGKEVTETATVLSANEGVVLRVGGHIEVLRDDGIPTRVIFDSIPQNLRASPTLSVTVDAASAGPREVTLSYLTAGLSWAADYVALFDEARGKLNLQGWVTLTNKSGTSFDDASVQLVAGDINIVDSEQDYWQRERQRREASRGAGTAPAGTQSISDYLLYSLAERVTIAQSQTKQVGFIDIKDVSASKAYEYDADSFSSDTTPEHAAVILKLRSVAKALPAGIARVYMRDASGASKFIGENYVDHAPAGSDLGIKIGEAFDVTVQATVVSSEKLPSRGTRYAMSYSLRNAQSVPATVELRQSGLWRDAEVQSESLPSKRIDASTLSWSVPVPANGETVLTFTVDAGR